MRFLVILWRIESMKMTQRQIQSAEGQRNHLPCCRKGHLAAQGWASCGVLNQGQVVAVFDVITLESQGLEHDSYRTISLFFFCFCFCFSLACLKSFRSHYFGCCTCWGQYFANDKKIWMLLCSDILTLKRAIWRRDGAHSIIHKKATWCMKHLVSRTILF